MAINTASLKTLVVDDHQLFREGVKRILDMEENFEIVEEFLSEKDHGFEVGKEFQEVIGRNIKMKCIELKSMIF
mgnify:CR=1 FL=1